MDRGLIVGDAGAGQRLRILSIQVQLLFLKHPPIYSKASSGESYPSRDLSYLPTSDAGEKRPLNRSSSYLSSNPFCVNLTISGGRRSTKYPAYDPEGQVMLPYVMKAVAEPFS